MLDTIALQVSKDSRARTLTARIAAPFLNRGAVAADVVTVAVAVAGKSTVPDAGQTVGGAHEDIDVRLEDCRVDVLTGAVPASPIEVNRVIEGLSLDVAQHQGV